MNLLLGESVLKLAQKRPYKKIMKKLVVPVICALFNRINSKAILNLFYLSYYIYSILIYPKQEFQDIYWPFLFRAF